MILVHFLRGAPGLGTLAGMSPSEPRRWRPDPPPLRWPPTLVIRPLLLGWVLALVATLAVPALHEDDRYWWPWCCVAGITLGMLGYLYVRRGKGNAADA